MQAYSKTSNNQYEIIKLFYNKGSSISFFYPKSHTLSKTVNDIYHSLLAYMNKEIESHI